MLNWIWLGFLLVAVIVAGFTGKLPDLTAGAFEAAKSAVMEIALPLMGIWAIWLGMMRLAEQSGLVQLLARVLRPAMRRLFPDVPPEHPAMGAMVLNMAANMLGLGNAATPLGLRAMAHLERLNPSPGVATNAMCTFLAINTASIQLLPTAAIAILSVNKSTNPTAIVPTAFLASVCAASSGVLAAKLLEKLPLFSVRRAAGGVQTATATPVLAEAETPMVETLQIPTLSIWGRLSLAAFFAAFFIFLALLVWPETVNQFVAGLHLAAPPQPESLAGKSWWLRLLYAVSILAIPFMLAFFPLYAALRQVRVYEQFVEGAKEAFDTAKRVIPFLVAMLVSIKMLQKAGVLDLLGNKLQPLLDRLHFPADLLPLVLIRPLSGSATTGIFVDLVQRLGPDSLASRIAATIYGSTETTFYVIAVYFGSVAVRQTRHAIAAGLVADTVAVVASVFLCRLLWA